MEMQSPEILASIANKFSKVEIAKYAIENGYNIRELGKLCILESENDSMKKYYIDNGDGVYSYFIETSSEIISLPLYSENSVAIIVDGIGELHLSYYDDGSVKSNPNNENEYIHTNGKYIIYYDKDLNEIKRGVKGKYDAELNTEDTLVNYYGNPITGGDHMGYIETENGLVCKTPNGLNFQIASEHNGEKVFKELDDSSDEEFGIITSDNQFYFIDGINGIDILEINLEKQEIIAFNARFKLSKNKESGKYELAKDELGRIIGDIIGLEETGYKVYLDENKNFNYIFIDEDGNKLENDNLNKGFEIKELEGFVLIKNHNWDIINFLYDKNNLKQIEFEGEAVLYKDGIYFIGIDDNYKRLILDENGNFTEDLKYKVREKVKKIFGEFNNIPDDSISILDNGNIEVIWKEKGIKVVLDNNGKVLYIENDKGQKLKGINGLVFDTSVIKGLNKYPLIKYKKTYYLEVKDEDGIFQINNSDGFYPIITDDGKQINYSFDKNFNIIRTYKLKIRGKNRLIDLGNPSEELLELGKTSINGVYEYNVYSHSETQLYGENMDEVSNEIYKKIQFVLKDGKLEEVRGLYINPEDLLNESSEEEKSKTSVLDKLGKAIADIVLGIIQNGKN